MGKNDLAIWSMFEMPKKQNIYIGGQFSDIWELLFQEGEI
jgi:hypothetical protein